MLCHNVSSLLPCWFHAFMIYSHLVVSGFCAVSLWSSSCHPSVLSRKQYWETKKKHIFQQLFYGLTFMVPRRCIPNDFCDPLTQEFLTRLVCNLLDEGNALFRDGEWEQAAREFTEGLNVSLYAAAEDLHISEVLLESLYVNRAAAYHSMVRRVWSCGLLRRHVMQISSRWLQCTSVLLRQTLTKW